MAKRNAVIQRLENRETVFSTIPIPNGNLNDFAALSNSAFDMVMIENEHQGYDSLLLRTSLQYLLNRRRILDNGVVVSPTPFVRVPPNTRETSEWIIKQVLDVGAMGLILPQLDSVEGAQAVVKAARYPRARNAPHRGPEGLRGWGPFVAADYWGLSPPDYYEAAGVWPLDPDGEILLMGICESVAGVKALPQILKDVKGIGAIWAGSGDLSVSMGLKGDHEHPEVEQECLEILRICKDHGVACATPITRHADAATRIDQGFEIVLLHTMWSMDELNKGLAKAGRR